MTDMKILVTGAAGFIGSHTCVELLKKGHTVVGLDNINDYYDVNLKKARVSHIRKVAKDNLLLRLSTRLSVPDRKFAVPSPCRPRSNVFLLIGLLT